MDLRFPLLFTRFSAAPRLMALSLAATFAAGLTGCVSMDEYKRLQTAHEQSLAQLATAEYDLMQLQKQISELQARIADLQRLLDLGTGGVGAITRERDLLSTRLADLQKRYDELLRLGNGPAVLAPEVNAALKDLVTQYPDLMEFDERLGMIRLKSDLTFDVGSTEVKPAAKAALARVASILNMQQIAKNEVQVVGHTDDIPIRAGGPTAARNPDNWTLSTNRAWAVLGVLHTGGLGDARGMASGWGEQRPIADNLPGKRGNEKNRRVDIFIRPTTVPDGIVVSRPGATAPPPTTRRGPVTPARGGVTPARGGTTPGRGGVTTAPSTRPGGVEIPF